MDVPKDKFNLFHICASDAIPDILHQPPLELIPSEVEVIRPHQIAKPPGTVIRKENIKISY